MKQIRFYVFSVAVFVLGIHSAASSSPKMRCANKICTVEAVTLENYIHSVDLTATDDFDSLATTLVFETSKLNTIPTTFMDDFTALETIKAEYCGIYVLHKSVFGEEHKKQFTNLTSLFLGHNEISKISNASFVNAENLRVLSLSYNQISVIESKAFQGLTVLEKLDLSNNWILDLDWTIFSENLHIQYLNLEENQIINYSWSSSSNETATSSLQLQFFYIDFTMELETTDSISHIHEMFPLLQELGIKKEKFACKILADWLDLCKMWNVTLKSSSHDNASNIKRCMESFSNRMRPYISMFLYFSIFTVVGIVLVLFLLHFRTQTAIETDTDNGKIQPSFMDAEKKIVDHVVEKSIC